MAHTDVTLWYRHSIRTATPHSITYEYVAAGGGGGGGGELAEVEVVEWISSDEYNMSRKRNNTLIASSHIYNLMIFSVLGKCNTHCIFPHIDHLR